MEAKLNRKIVVGIGGVAVAVAILAGMYLLIVRPRMKDWNETRAQIKDRQKRLDQLRKDFSDQDDPSIELRILYAEVQSLEEANKALEKVKKAGRESEDLPEQLKDPDPKIKLELHRDFIKEVMASDEEKITKDLEGAEITPPDFKLYTELKYPGEAAYYMNRSDGLRGIVNSMVKAQSRGSDIIIDKLTLEDYAKGSKRRSAAGNVLSYFFVMTMDAKSLVSFMYNLKDEEGYYFVEEMTIKPATRGRFGGSEDPKLLIDARINTVMIYKSEVEKEIKKGAAKAAEAKGRVLGDGKVTGFLALAMGMKKSAEKEVERAANKKWYEFWK